jgi:hypothetical protein
VRGGAGGAPVASCATGSGRGQSRRTKLAQLMRCGCLPRTPSRAASVRSPELARPGGRRVLASSAHLAVGPLRFVVLRGVCINIDIDPQHRRTVNDGASAGGVGIMNGAVQGATDTPGSRFSPHGFPRSAGDWSATGTMWCRRMVIVRWSWLIPRLRSEEGNAPWRAPGRDDAAASW